MCDERGGGEIEIFAIRRATFPARAGRKVIQTPLRSNAQILQSKIDFLVVWISASVLV
jgi:hypothetical protein